MKPGVSCPDTKEVFETYGDYIKKSVHWRETRKKFRASKHHKGKCFVCSHPRNLNLHHRTYKRVGKERLTDLVELCRDCHVRVHMYVDEGRTSISKGPEFLLELYQWLFADELGIERSEPKSRKPRKARRPRVRKSLEPLVKSSYRFQRPVVTVPVEIRPLPGKTSVLPWEMDYTQEHLDPKPIVSKQERLRFEAERRQRAFEQMKKDREAIEKFWSERKVVNG